LTERLFFLARPSSRSLVVRIQHRNAATEWPDNPARAHPFPSNRLFCLNNNNNKKGMRKNMKGKMYNTHPLPKKKPKGIQGKKRIERWRKRFTAREMH
jgi:hypothetical protein